MKKLALTIAIVLGISSGVFAQGGLFQYGNVSDEDYYGSTYWALDENNRFLDRYDSFFPMLPDHGSEGNENATPLGGGALLLIGFGAAYALKKKNEK